MVLLWVWKIKPIPIPARTVRHLPRVYPHPCKSLVGVGEMGKGSMGVGVGIGEMGKGKMRMGVGKGERGKGNMGKGGWGWV